MNVKPLLIANTILVAAMVGLSLWVAPGFAEDAQLPTHWGLDGVADGFSPKWQALLFLPGLSVLVTLFLVVLPAFDPRRQNLEQSAKLWNASAIATVLVLGCLHVFLILSATGHAVDIRDAVLPGIAGLFIVVGNYLGKTRSNWFAGIRTPWTLSSDYAWEKTHRWTGRLFVCAGLAIFAAWLLTDAKIALYVMIAATAATTLAALVMSYVFWRNDPDRNGVNGGA
jgi:uncharacterized membrane protein